MNRISLVLIGLTMFFAACTNNEKETPNGMKFTVIKAGDGKVAKKDEILVFEYSLKDSKDSTWSETYSQGMPAAVPIGDSSALPNENGMVQMFRMLSKGDSVKVTMTMNKFFSTVVGQPTPPGMDTALSLSYYIQVRDIMNMNAYREFQTGIMEKNKVGQVAKDASIITKYLADKNITAQKDTSGIMYVIHSSKGGAKPSVQNCVEVKYKGSFMESGRTFDQQETMAFPLSRVIPGWQLAIPMLGVGDSATFYIPSGLAYGAQGMQGAIPPNSILIFDVTLLGFGNAFDESTRTCK